MSDQHGGHFGNADNRHVHGLTPQNDENISSLDRMDQGPQRQETGGTQEVIESDEFSMVLVNQLYERRDRQQLELPTRSIPAPAQEVGSLAMCPTDTNYEERRERCLQSFTCHGESVCSQQKKNELSNELVIYLGVDAKVKCTFCKKESEINDDQHHTRVCKMVNREHRIPSPLIEEEQEPNDASMGMSLEQQHYGGVGPGMHYAPVQPERQEFRDVSRNYNVALPQLLRLDQENTNNHLSVRPELLEFRDDPILYNRNMLPQLSRIDQPSSQENIGGQPEDFRSRGCNDSYTCSFITTVQSMPASGEGAIGPILPPVLQHPERQSSEFVSNDSLYRTSEMQPRGAEAMTTPMKPALNSEHNTKVKNPPLVNVMISQLKEMGFKTEVIMKALGTNKGIRLIRTNNMEELVTYVLYPGSSEDGQLDENLCGVCNRTPSNIMLFDCGCYVCSRCKPSRHPAKCPICSKPVRSVSKFNPDVRNRQK